MEDEKQFSTDPSTLESDNLEVLTIDSIPLASASSSAAASGGHGEWQKVVYPKRQRRQALNPAAAVPVANGHVEGNNVFASVDQKGQERRRAIELAAAEAEVARSLAAVAASEDENDDSGAEAAAGGEENGEGAKKPKQKKLKKPKLTVAAASEKIDASNLAAFLADVSVTFESQPSIQLTRFADYFGQAFAGVSASQFPWTKLLKESPVPKMVDIPLCHIEESVYKVSVDWIGLRPPEALGNFVMWCLDSILADLANQQVALKGLKKAVAQSPSKSQVAIFFVLAMVLRRKPDVLVNCLPKLRDNKYQGLEKLPVIIWTIAQAAQGDLVVGMYLWAQYLLPLISDKSGNNPQSRDLILQLVERILSSPKAQPVLMNGAVRKGERLIPPSAFDQLMRTTFPAASLRVKATERFEAVYPFLKQLALAGSAGTKTTKQASQQLLPLVIKAIQENNPEITEEAIDVFIWCLVQNSDCYRQWEKLYLENMAASVAVLEKLCVDWKKRYSIQLAPLNTLRETLKHLRAKNVEALAGSDDANHITVVKDADKYCKMILGRSAHGPGKCGTFSLVLAVAICALILAPNMEYLNIKKLSAMLSGSSI